MKRKVFIIISIIICVIVLNYFASEYYFSNFSITKWENNIFKREKMLDSLIDNYKLIDMTKEQIVDLLGTSGMTIDSNVYLYNIGKSYIGPIMLAIYFDDNNYVEKFSVVTD